MNNKKASILTFVPYYLPGYKSGGPIRSIKNMVERMSRNFNFKIVTSDRDATDTSSYNGIKSDTWIRVGEANVYYSSRQGRSFCQLYKILNNTTYDILYLSSVFFFDFTIKPLLLRRLFLLPQKPIVLAARGEFSKGALAIKSLKKKSFLSFARAIGLYSGLTWQASSSLEAKDIRRVMGDNVSVSIAPNLAPANDPPDVRHKVKPRGQLRVLFLSRISPKKNLHRALELLSKVNATVKYTIVGPVRDKAYWVKCQNIINNLPKHITVEYRGSVPHSEVSGIMADHDLFFMPTAGENYGHVIQEALAAGTPVLISDQTPWRGLEEKSVGWDFSLAYPSKFVGAIEACAQKEPSTYMKWRQHVAAWQADIQNDNSTLDRNVQLFRQVLRQSASKPTN